MPTVTQDLILDEPQVAGPLAVYPVIGSPGALAYRSFAQARVLGAFVKELDEGASVGDLLVGNPTDVPVLLLEGEEVLGAQQNRSFDLSVLADAGEQIRVPVSCVERGRWDDARSEEHFEPAPQAVDPALRRVKRARVNENVARGVDARADQGEVWSEVDARMFRLHAVSDSDALHDVYESRRSDLHALAGIVAPVAGQLGAIACVSGRPVAFDLVSRAEVFADLLPRLAQGYALEAMDRPVVGPDARTVERFLAAALGAPRRVVPTPGMADGFATTTADVSGGGLMHDGQLIALSAFPGAAPTGGPILRPRHRRPSA